MPTNAFFASLSADALTAGRLFDGLAAGSFTDMHGRSVTFKLEELPIYLANTLAAIAATKSESGEIVGLPIDCRDHDNGNASGWIIGAELAGNRIRLMPKWTDLGVDLVKRGVQRFFSATIDTVNKVILGGTLTNWPATRDPQGKVMLRPIELSAGTTAYQLADDAEDSLNDKLQDVYDAWHAQYMPPEPLPYCRIVEVFDDHLIIEMDDDLYSVTYSRAGQDGDEVIFAPRDEWKPVKQTYIEAAMKQLRRVLKPFGFTRPNAQNDPGGTPKGAAPVQPTGDDDMIKFADMTAEDKLELARLVSTLTPPPAAPAAAATSAVDLSQLLGVTPLTEEGKKKLTELMAQQAANVQEQAELAFKAQMATIQRETALTDLSMRITGGTPDAPRGIKGATAEELKRHLSALPVAEAKWFGDLLTGIVKDGLAEFSELGHARKLHGTTALPPEFAASLDKGEIKLADLTSPLLGLGDLTQYDLSKWQGK